MPSGRFTISGELTPPADVYIHMEGGAIIAPLGSGGLFKKTARPTTAETGISSGASLGSSRLRVRTTAGFRVGSYVYFSDPAPSPQPFPVSWSKISSVDADSGTIVLEEPLAVTYPATFRLYQRPLNGGFRFSGGMIDMSGITGVAAKGMIDVAGYRSAEVNGVTFRGPYASTTVFGLVTLTGNRTATVRDCVADEVTLFAQAFAIEGARTATVSDCTIDGDCFGVYLGNNDFDRVSGVTYTGRYTAGTGYSMRAVKTQGARHAIVSNVIASNCETVVSWIDSGRGRIADIVGVNIGLLRPGRGQTAINIVSTTANGQQNTIGVTGVVLENVGGNGIQISGDSAGRIILSDINIRSCHTTAIVMEAVYVDVNSAIIEDWNIGGSKDGAAIISSMAAPGAAVRVRDITFVNGRDKKSPCLKMAEGPQYHLSGIIAADGNPLHAAK